jgi:hypothetical protein
LQRSSPEVLVPHILQARVNRDARGGFLFVIFRACWPVSGPHQVHPRGEKRANLLEDNIVYNFSISI